MKKWVKGLLITAAVILVIGFGFLGAAFCTGFTSQAARETFHKYSGYFSDWDFVWDDDDDDLGLWDLIWIILWYLFQ